MNLIETVKAGDRVTIVTRHGSRLSGRAVMPSSAGGWVLDGGGRHGTPLLADASNVVRVSRPRARRAAAPAPAGNVISMAAYIARRGSN